LSSHQPEDLRVTELSFSQDPHPPHREDPLAGLPECVIIATEQLLCELLEAADAEVDLDNWDVQAAELDVAVKGARAGWLVTVTDLSTRSILGSTTVFEPTSAAAIAA